MKHGPQRLPDCGVILFEPLRHPIPQSQNPGKKVSVKKVPECNQVALLQNRPSGTPRPEPTRKGQEPEALNTFKLFCEQRGLTKQVCGLSKLPVHGLGFSQMSKVRCLIQASALRKLRCFLAEVFGGCKVLSLKFNIA